MKLLYRRLLRLSDAIEAIADEESLVAAELSYHISINDDAQRDAAVGDHFDRREAGATAADVARFVKTLAGLRRRRARLEDKRRKLLARLSD